MSTDRTALTARLMDSTKSIEQTRAALHALGTTKGEAEAYLAPYQPAAPKRVAAQSRTAAFLTGFVSGAMKTAKKRGR